MRNFPLQLPEVKKKSLVIFIFYFMSVKITKSNKKLLLSNESFIVLVNHNNPGVGAVYSVIDKPLQT